MDRREAERVGVANASVVADQLHDWAEGFDSPDEMLYNYEDNVYDTLVELDVRPHRSREEGRLHDAAGQAYWAHLVELGVIEYPLDEDKTSQAGEPIYSDDFVIIKPGLDGVQAFPAGHYLKRRVSETHSVFEGPLSEREARAAILLMHHPDEPTSEQASDWYMLYRFPPGLSVDYLEEGEIAYLQDGGEMSGEFRPYTPQAHEGWSDYDDPVAWINDQWFRDMP
jgi:hypothetical protein